MLRFFTLMTALWLALAVQARSETPLTNGVVATSDNFKLLSDAPVDARSILADLEEFQTAVMADLGLQTSEPEPALTISIVDDPEIFALITPGGITAAIYRQSAIGDDIVVGYSSKPDHLLSDALHPDWLRLVLRHEVVHHILETHYQRKLPIWLGEGLAEHYATYRVGADGEADFGTALPEQERLDDTSDWLPMRSIVESLVRYPDFRSFSHSSQFRSQRLYYGQSWALAQFVMDQPQGLARIHRFIDGWDQDTDSEDSFERAFGLRYEPLEARIREDAAQQTVVVSTSSLSSDTERIAVRAASPSILQTNHLRLLLTHGAESEQTDDMIAALETDLSDSAAMSSRNIRLARGLRAWRQGDWDGADDMSHAVLRDNHVDATALKLKTKTAYGRVSEWQSDEALWAEAETSAVRALSALPNDPELHLFRVAVSLPDADGLSADAIQSLNWLEKRQTHLRLPHTAMMMIPALIYDGRLNHADAVLDSASRWTESRADTFVIDRLRANVASERAEKG